jgi:hypothetical protein
MKRKERLEPVEVINSRWAKRKGVVGRVARSDDADE